MKTAVIINYDKIKKIKEKINQEKYIEQAIKQLSYEITWMFD